LIPELCNILRAQTVEGSEVVKWPEIQDAKIQKDLSEAIYNVKQNKKRRQKSSSKLEG
jgi:hypothetical protein